MSRAIFPFVTKSSDKEINFSEVNRIANTFNLHPKVAELLFLKGISDEPSIQAFLHPNKDDFHNPYLMKNMSAIKARLDEAVKNGEKIVIYGDYDCDGVCSCAMLSLYLSGLGLDVFCHIPNREGDGYGLNIETLERIIENVQPDLILTCDCGISCHDEVEFVLDLGIDIIVTDHHEPAEILPNCLILNPKQAACSYPFSQLCGAGVVLKLIEAHGGREKMLQYNGLAALATVADLVPLTDENRLIVKLGLDYQHLLKNLGLKALLNKLNISEQVLASDIAFKIAPRINAAGRMGDAYRAFQLLTSDSESEVASIVEEIERDNDQRRDLCTKLYDEAMEIIARDDLIAGRALILCHPQWEKGITGIVAARLTGEFYRPTFILVRSGDCYKGTARSVEDINIHGLLTSVKDLLLEYGGHSQAAGFSIAEENIAEFRKRVAKYLDEFSSTSFIAKTKYDLDIEIGDISLEFMQDLERIEPFGNSNSRPLFRLKVSALKVSAMNNAEHLSINLTDDINLLAFGYGKQAHQLSSNEPKELIIDLKLNNFRGKQKIDAYIRALAMNDYIIDDQLLKANFIKYINYANNTDAKYSTYDEAELDNLIGESIFGTLIITGTKSSYERLLKIKNIGNIVVHEDSFSTIRNNYTRVMAAPEFDENLLLASYRKIIFLDQPLTNGVICYLNKKTAADVYIPKKSDFAEILDGINLDRETFAKYYKFIKENQSIMTDDLNTYLKISTKNINDFDIRQFIVCLSVFIELDLVKIVKKKFSISIKQGGRANLETSKTYSQLTLKLQQIRADI